MQKLGIWSGIVFLLFFLAGFCIFAKFTPPVSPALDAAGVAGFYAEHRTGIKLGGVLTMLGAMLSVPWAVVIAIRMAHVEGRYPVLAGTQLASGILDVIVFIPAATFWVAAAFRPERELQLIQALNDLGWITIVMGVSPATLQALAMGLFAVVYPEQRSGVPRWSGFANLWFTFFFLGGTLVPFFKTGPFAWNGLFAYWLPLILFAAWIVFNSWIYLRAIKRQTS